MTGGSYGIEASATGTIAVLIGLVIVWKLPVKKLAKPAIAAADRTCSPKRLSGIQPSK